MCRMDSWIGWSVIASSGAGVKASTLAGAGTERGVEMERSIYNIEAKGYEGEHVFYNTLKRGLVVLNDEAYADYLAGEGPHVHELAAAGLLVESAQYEKDIQEQQFDLDRKTNDWFALCICPTYDCNYQCPYCYEHGYNPSGTITREVIEATYDFFEKIYERDGFVKFSLGWYGGEPTLHMDVIEEMTEHFRSRCDELGVDMAIGILSNCGVIDEELAGRLAACGVEHMMPTIDGLSKLHNCRRVSKSAGDAFEKTIEGAHNCRAAGITVRANMNADKINMREFKELRKWLHEEHDIDLYPSLLKDYRQDFNHNDTGFCEPAFDLYTREDYAHDLHDLFAETPYTPEVFEGLFRPVRDFCRGQLENYYVIDPFGDVYKCEGWLGHKEYCFFNVLDLPDVKTLYLTDYNPLRDPYCEDCAVMPLCKGQCAWDRALLEQVCHVAKFTIADYVADYRSCFGDAPDPVTVLVEPTTPESYLETPFECDGPNESRWAGIPWYPVDEDGNATYSKGKPYRDEERKAHKAHA